MNIQKALLNAHSKENMLRVVHFIGTDEERFAELMACFLKGTFKESQRAAFAFKLCVDEHPQLIHNWWQPMLKNLDRPVHDAVIRNTLSAWLKGDIPETLQGEVYERAFNYLTNSKMPIAIRAQALSICTNFALLYPALKNEIIIIAKDFILHDKAALNARARHCLTLLK